MLLVLQHPVYGTFLWWHSLHSYYQAIFVWIFCSLVRPTESAVFFSKHSFRIKPFRHFHHQRLKHLVGPSFSYFDCKKINIAMLVLTTGVLIAGNRKSLPYVLPIIATYLGNSRLG